MPDKGLINVRRGRRPRVRQSGSLRPVAVNSGSLVRARMPTPRECEEYAISEGVPVLTVDDRVFPADQVILMIGG